MHYFDRGLLAQYLDQRIKLKVYVDSEWYEIADQSDLQDDIDGIGSDQYGAPHRFDYRDIQQIKAGANTVIDLEGLQKMMQGQAPAEKSDKPKSDSGGEEPSMDEPPADEPPEEKPEKGPDLSWFSPSYDVGRSLLRELKRKKGNVK